MELKAINLHLKLPSKVENTLYLIKEELKSRKFFNSLRESGLDDCHYQPHLDELIMASVGLDDDSNETFDFYYNTIEEYSEKIVPGESSAVEQAFNVYLELVIEVRRKRSQKQRSL